jgi:acyl carrier protein
MAVDATDRIRRFIREEIAFEGDDGTLGDDTALLPDVIDSLGLTQIVAFIEGEFGVDIDEGEMSAANFATIADINRLIQRKVQETT